MEYVIVKASDTNPIAIELREQYFALRSKAYDHFWGERIYPNGPDTYDLRATTCFVLAVEHGKVVAGARSVFHTPGSNEKVPMEDKHPAMAIERLLPHLDTRNLSYCEGGGLVVDPDIAAQGNHVGAQLIVKRLEMIHNGEIKNGDVPVDVVISSASSRGIGPLVHAVRKQGTIGIVRTDLIQQEEDDRFKTLLYPVVFSPKPNFPLVPPGLKEGDAVSLNEFTPPKREQGR